MIVVDNSYNYSIWITASSLVCILIIVCFAVRDIRRTVKSINYTISSFDDLIPVRNTINLNMTLVWPAIIIIVIYGIIMTFLTINHHISLEVLRNNLLIFLAGTIIWGQLARVNEKKIKTLNVTDPQLITAYKAMLKDWVRRWFRLRPTSAYLLDPEPTEKTVKTISNYTEM